MKIKLRLFKLRRSRQGFSLIEILIAIAIASVLGFGVAVTIFQIFNVNAGSNAHLKAVTQVQNAIHYLNRDVQMAQTVLPQGASGFPLTLSWITWSNNDSNQIVYSLSGGNLVRQYSINGGQPSSFTVAKDLSMAVADTNCAYDGNNHKLTAKLTASSTYGAKQASETRQIEIIPRPGS